MKPQFSEYELLRYLNQYNQYSSKIQLLTPSAFQLLEIDANWHEILSCHNREERVKRTIQLWQDYVPEFRSFIQFMRQKLVSIDAIFFKDTIAIIYSFQLDHAITYCAGLLPYDIEHFVINELPKPLQTFYRFIHDGFIFYPNEDSGLLSCDDFVCLADRISQDKYFPNYDVTSSYLIFSNSYGDGIVYDINTTPIMGFTYIYDDHKKCNFDEDPINTMCVWLKTLMDSD